MKRIIFYAFLFLMTFTGCQQNWDDYYEKQGNLGDGASYSGTLLEYLKNESKYSEFVKLLEETKIADELTRKQILTIWAPTNETLPAEVATMSLKEKIRLCQNHINYVALTNTKLENDKLVKMLSGKNLLVKEPALDQFTIDKLKVVGKEQGCNNGVVHELEGWLIPRNNIFEYILECGPEYSTIRDSLLARSDTVFKPGLSFPLGVDELGNTIYDSVFVIENSLFLGDADVRSEDKDFTFFLPDNRSINEMYRGMADYFQSAGLEFTQRDSSKFFTWMLLSIIHEGKVEEYTGNLKSVFKFEWRAEKQLIKPGRKEVSNGYVYDIEKIHIPKFLYLTPMKTYSTYLASFSDEERIKYYAEEGMTKMTWAYPDGAGKVLAFAEGREGFMFEFDTFIKDRFGEIMEGKLVPGYYKISAAFRTWLAGKVKISINGEEVATIDAGKKNVYDYKDGLVVETFEIKEEWANKMLRIRLEDVGKKKRLTPVYFLFEPTEDNY